MSERAGRRWLLPGIGTLAGLAAALWRPGGREAVVDAGAGVELRRGALAAGGLSASWPARSPDGPVAKHIEFQYAGMAHQSEAALAGMWLFLATEALFFGGLFLLYLVYRGLHPEGIAEASRHAVLWIGTTNTILLVTSSAVFAYGFGRAKQGDNRRLFVACLITGGLGTAFLLLKFYEWTIDFDENLFPGARFAITGEHANSAQLFWCFYFIATGLHAIHMVIGVGLVGWIAWAARRQRFSPGYATPVEAVGLYWSFVDMVWLCLYPLIYLVDRGG